MPWSDLGRRRGVGGEAVAPPRCGERRSGSGRGGRERGSVAATARPVTAVVIAMTGFREPSNQMEKNLS
jgi:hypothetical protein